MRSFLRTSARVAGLLALMTAAGLPNLARTIDDFNDNTKTDWEDADFGVGKSTEVNGQLKFEIPAAGQPLFFASTKTSETFTLQDGRTIEFRVDMISGNSKDSFAILSWTPTSAPVTSLAGYALAKSSTDVLITKGINKYFYNENPEPAIKNENVTLVLSLTGAGSSVIINAKILDKDNNNAVLFDKTFVDTPAADILSDGNDDPAPAYLGTGHFVLMEYEDFEAGGPDVYEVVLDNAEAYVLDRATLDDFNDNQKTDWQDAGFGVGQSTETGGQFKFEIPAAGQPLFFSSTKTSRTFDVTDGQRIEFSVDLVSGNGKDSFAILSWTPTSASVTALAGYAIAKSTTDILITKGINKYFYNENPEPEIKNDNVTLVLSLTGVGSSVVIHGKVLDKDNNNAVLFEKTFVDTAAADILSDGTDDPAPAYQGSGHFVLMEYEDFEAGGVDIYEVIFDNAVAAAPPVVGNLAPVIGEVQPAEFANFLPASTQVSFKVTDDKPLVDNQISVTLNGETFTSANGLTLAGTGNARTATLGGLEPNATYAAKLQAVDSDGATNSFNLYFDTFLTSNFVIEAEDYNFAGGQFYNNPILIAELTGPVEGAYAGQAGIQDIDFSDTRASANNYPYRPDDPIGTKRTLDATRAKFTAAGGAAGEIYDYDIGEIETGEYLNYTRDFPAGSYEVYLRESLFNTIQAETLLEKVTSDPTQPDQTATTLGSFLGSSSGTKFRNVPLTDALGQKVVVRLSGRETLRLRQVTPDPSDGNIYQNYLIFVPASETGTQHAAVTSVTPAAGSTYESIAPLVSATIQNRDTTVKTNSILMQVDGQAVTPSIVGTETGATVSYKLEPLPAANSSHSVAVVFTDNEDFTQTNEWNFTLVYKALGAANAIQGTGQERGFKIRVVQAPSGSGLENSLGRAEDQLAPNSSIPAYYSTNVIEQVVNFSEMGPDSADGYFEGDLLIPGLMIEENGSDDIAMEILTYLELPAGTHRFGVRCDDGYKIVSGASLTDSTTAALMFRNGGTADETADFVVPRTGFYPFRMVWYERGGSAHVEWFSVNPATQERTLINDPNSPTAIKAYTSVAAATPEVVLESKVRITDAFTVDSTATVDTAAGTVSVPMTGPSGFYRLRYTGQSIIITGYRVTGTTLTILYSDNSR